MFRFAQPHYLWLLILIPVLLVFFIYTQYKRKKDLATYGNPRLLGALMPDVAYGKQRLKFYLQLISIALIVFVIAGPQFGSKLETVKKQGVEIMVALDVSNSMLAEDIAPNRLEKAKQMLSRLVDKLRDDKVGLIVFAGDAFTQLPITNDYVSAKMFMSSISPEMVSAQGTSIGAAINLAVRSFTPNESSDKGIIVITDGENHEGNAVEAAQAAYEKGIRVNVIGIGGINGSPVPDGRNGFRKDRSGNTVVSKLNETMAKEIAAAGHGIYARADNTNAALNALVAAVEDMNATELESRVYSDYDDKFYVLAWILIVVILLDMLVLDRRNSMFAKVKLF